MLTPFVLIFPNKSTVGSHANALEKRGVFRTTTRNKMFFDHILVKNKVLNPTKSQ